MSAGCCFGRGWKQGECLGQVRGVDEESGWGWGWGWVGDAVSEQK